MYLTWCIVIVLKRQLQKARNKGDFKEVSNLHNQIGVVYRELQLYDEALQEHEVSTHLLQEIKGSQSQSNLQFRA